MKLREILTDILQVQRLQQEIAMYESQPMIQSAHAQAKAWRALRDEAKKQLQELLEKDIT